MSYSIRRAADAQASGYLGQDWGTIRWLASRELGNIDGMTVGRVVIGRGKSNPRHCHRTCEEVLYLLKGKLRHSAGDQTVILEPGDTLTIAPGIFHHADNIGDEDADMIVAYSTGERDFVLEEPTAGGLR